MRGTVAKRLRRQAREEAPPSGLDCQVYTYRDTTVALFTHDGPVWNRTYRVHPDTVRGHYLRLKRQYKKAQR